MRRELEQGFALRQRFGDQPEFEVLEVAEAAVDQLGAPRRRVRGQIVTLDEKHREAAARGVARDARAVDAAADDQEVEGSLVGHRRLLVYRMRYDERPFAAEPPP